MTVKVTKSSINLREELASLNKPSGIVGESILRADTAADAVEQLNLEDHTFTTFTSTGIDDNATSTAMTLDSSGRVGIGTSSPSATLHISNPNNSTLPAFIESNVSAIALNIGSRTGSDFGNIGFTSDDGATPLAMIGSVGDSFRIFTGGHSAEAMRIDSSGNLLVGKTTTGANTAGMAWISNEYLQLANTETGAGDRALLINRQSADGTLIEFRKANTIVGSIGVEDTGNTSALYIGFADTGLSFQGHTNNSITPIRTDTGANYSGVLSLGADGSSFKDLYLSGGVYLGGTGSANLLDDYEEGTFTPEAADAASGGNTAAGYDNRYGYYRKIGSLCYLNIQMVNIDTTGMTAGADLVIRGLPFTQQNLSGAVSCGTIRAEQITVDASCYGLTPRVSANNSYIVISENISGANDDTITVGDLNSGAADIWVSITMQLAT
jgi:hypothetical protein